MTDVTDTETTVREYIARINAHDARGIVALCTADHIFIDSLGSTLSGLDRLERAG
jgi:ketosteroid isomerase-like protein